jgi:hypothetical protein
MTGSVSAPRFAFGGPLIYNMLAVWGFRGRQRRVCKLDSPIFLSDLRQHKVLSTASFVRVNFQGRGHLVSEYWPYLHSMICERNAKARKTLARYAPDRV